MRLKLSNRRKPLSRGKAALVGVGVIVAGVLAAPQPAAAYSISSCAVFRPLQNPTYMQVQCKGGFLDSDTYQAHVRCNGTEYKSGNVVTPIFGGWGPWATARCPSGQTWSSSWYTTAD